MMLKKGRKSHSTVNGTAMSRDELYDALKCLDRMRRDDGKQDEPILIMFRPAPLKKPWLVALPDY
jgi:hypothetical protein